ncbi:MAG: MBL fold metallo-hydrolase [Paracoccaceae bacterium]
MSAKSPKLTRRAMLQTAAAAPLAAAVAGTAASPVLANGQPSMAPNAIKNSFKLGDLEVSTLLSGSVTREEPQKIFGMNISEEEFANVSAENFLPTDKTQFFFTPTVVNTGSEVVLFDTGLNAPGITAPLAAAGYSPDDIDVIVLTHMHGDHIGGLTGEDGSATFKNARYVTGQAEFDNWAKADNDRFNSKVKPLAEKMSFIGDGGEVASGITGMAAFGHTPGHMVYMLESGGKQLVVTADTANHYVWSLAYPEWEVKFDMDKAAAAATRKQVFGMLAADKIPFIGYHMPFPGMGFVETRGEGGFRYVPASYQMML